MLRKRIEPDQARPKIEQYCAYQERSHYEVREKLYSFGLHKAEVEELIGSLIEGNFLNEERFAVQFTGGHFRLKQWGKQKIRLGLQQKRVSEYNIRRALDTIDPETYRAALEKLAAKKWQTLKSGVMHHLERKALLTRYLIQKGYESPLVRNVVEAITTQ